MILKYFLLVFIAVFFSASDPYFGYEITWAPPPREVPGDVKELAWQSTDAFLPYLQDHENRLGEVFKVRPYYFPTVHFWFLIYTQFESSQVVIHDKSNMALIYKVLDFSPLYHKGLNANVRWVLQQKIAGEKMKELKGDLEALIKDPFSLSSSSKALYRTLKQSGIAAPIARNERIAFFRELKENLRSQTGQKNFISDGIVRSRPYHRFLTSYFEDRKLPRELLAIPFLESSFNPRAHSKANALGVWQFMPFIAAHFVPKRTKNFDYRSNIGVASVSAAFLMSENFQIMKSWDLAVTAYNSGTKHLLKTKRELGRTNVGLEDIIEHSDSRHFGFASKNFYSEFLALAHTLAYRDELFPELRKDLRHDADLDLGFYLLKCSIRPEKDLTQSQRDDILFHNHHLDGLKSTLPRGLIVTAKSELPAGKFLKLSREKILKVKPKNWARGLNQSCSTR